MHELLKKLNHKNQNPLLILNPPVELNETLENWKEKLSIHLEAQEEQYDFILAFVESVSALEDTYPKITSHTGEQALIWFAYPKKSSKQYKTDINRDHGWNILGKDNYEKVRQIAVNEDWSALRFKKADQIREFKRNSSFMISVLKINPKRITGSCQYIFGEKSSTY